MNEELINQIVRRILSDPSLQGLLNGSGSLEGNQGVKSEALVLLNYVSDFPRVLSSVQQRWGVNHTLKLLPSDQVFINKPELPAGMTWIPVEEAMSQDWQTIILPTCSPNTLAKAALGIRDNPICEMIGRGISKGNSIELVTEYLGLTAQTPQAYRELYEGYIQKLKSYGVTILEALEEGSSFPARLSQEKVSNPHEHQTASIESMKPLFNTESPSPQNEIHYAKKFLGDKQAYGFPEGATVFVKQTTVISPLARDTLKLRRIELYIEKEDGR